MTRHWSWITPRDAYPRLFGEIAAALADRLDASHVLFAANCVDDEELEQELRSEGFSVQVPQRKKRWIGTVSHGSLRAWRVVPRDEAAATLDSLYRGTTSIYGYPTQHASGQDSWSDVEELMKRELPHLVSHDADSVTVEAPPPLEEGLISEAWAAAERIGGEIKEL